MKRILSLFIAVTALALSFSSCEESDNTVYEYSNWKLRNDTAFANRLSEAKSAIAAAKSQYGDAWEEHCDWRVLRLYSYQEDEAFKSTDTVCVRILERGTGSGSPIDTDSVLVNYIGRIIPTTMHPEGRIFDHSGLSNDPNEVFNSEFSAPTAFLVSNLVAGFTTALIHMHIGDKWRIFIHPTLGYDANSLTGIPAHSMLTFDVQLKAYFRTGTPTSGKN